MTDESQQPSEAELRQSLVLLAGQCVQISRSSGDYAPLKAIADFAVGEVTKLGAVGDLLAFVAQATNQPTQELEKSLQQERREQQAATRNQMQQQHQQRLANRQSTIDLENQLKQTLVQALQQIIGNQTNGLGNGETVNPNDAAVDSGTESVQQPAAVPVQSGTANPTM